MRASTPTKLSLWDFADQLGISPIHVGGIDVEPLRSNCSTPWIQYEFQDADRVGREAIARAIATAESKIEDYLGFRLLPTYEANEKHRTPQPYHPEFVNYNGRRIQGFQATVQADWRYVREYGIRATTPLTIVQQTVGPNLVDLVWVPNQPGYAWEVASVIADATGVLDPQEIHVYYPGHLDDPTWEIKPIAATIDSTTHQATIIIRRELMVLDSKWDTISPEAVDGTDDTAFLSTVDVQRVYTDPSVEGALLFEPLPYCNECQSAGGSGCVRCSYLEATACLYPRGIERDGQTAYRPAQWDAETQAFKTLDLVIGRQPDDIRINYLAGWEDKTSRTPLVTMDRKWREAVVYFAAALLERPPCDCSPDYWEYWREDLSTTFNPRGGAITNVSPQDLLSPFGTRRGAVFAWKRVTDGAAIGKAVSYR